MAALRHTPFWQVSQCIGRPHIAGTKSRRRAGAKRLMLEEANAGLGSRSAGSKAGFATIRRNETLAKIGLFRSLNADTINELDSKSVWRRYSRNDWIIEHHEISNDVFFVLSGMVRLKIPSSSGRKVLFQDLGAGSYFGEVDAIDAQPSRFRRPIDAAPDGDHPGVDDARAGIYHSRCQASALC